MRRQALLAVWVCLALLGAGDARAHVRSVSYSSWRLGAGGAHVVARISRLDASALGPSRGAGAGDAVARRIRDAFLLRTPSGECRAGPPREREAGREWVEVEWELSCGDGAPDRVEVGLLFSENPSHLHLLTLVRGGAAPLTRALDAADRTVAVEARAPARPGAGRFVTLGVEHILTGWDHLALVLLLVIGAAGLGAAAWTISGFTLGHALTLSLATLGVVVPHAAPVEALIAASVGLVAVENAWRGGLVRRRGAPVVTVAALAASAACAAALGRPAALALAGAAVFAACWFGLLARARRVERLRAGAAALFGLVHGLGFARVLGELALPRAELLRALLGFNAGVELGQLGVVLLAWPLVVAARRAGASSPLVVASSALGLALAVYWLIERAFG